MKKKFVWLFFLGFTLLSITTSRAQITIANSLSCDVKITWESHINTPPSCSVCGFGSVTIFAGTNAIVGCSGDVCISVTDVGGNAITFYNHANSLGVCHGGPGCWIIGMSSTGQCAGGWSASWNTGCSILTIQ